MNPTTRTIFRSITVFAAVLIGAFASLTAPASAAVTGSVRSACMSDYFAYCAGMEVGSSELRRCMNKAGSKLQPACVSALVAAGEVSKAEVDRRSSRVASNSAKRSASKVANRSVCATGPARPGARNSTTCRNVASSRSKSSRRQFALR